MIPSGKFGKSLLRLAGRLAKTKPSQPLFATSPPPPNQVDSDRSIIKMERPDEMYSQNSPYHSPAAQRVPIKRQNDEHIDDTLDIKRRRQSDTMMSQNAQNSPDSGWNSGELSDSSASIPSPTGIHIFDHGRNRSAH